MSHSSISLHVYTNGDTITVLITMHNGALADYRIVMSILTIRHIDTLPWPQSYGHLY